MSSSPAISVIIPTYNCDRYLAQAIDSVVAQTLQDYEIIVIDDGSNDDTAQVMERYVAKRSESKSDAAKRYPESSEPYAPTGLPIRYICQSNQGVAVARNHGIQLARGVYIAFLDADDWLVPTKLEHQLKILEDNVDVGMVHSGWQRVDANGQRLMEVKPWLDCPRLDLEQWLQWKPVLPSAMMFRKDWLLKADGFDPRFPPAEDTDLVLRLAAMGCQTAWLEEITVCYRQHDESAMHKGLPQARSLSAVINQFFHRSDLPPTIRRNERKTRFSTWAWIAWYLHYTGHPDAMVQYLKESWQYSHHPPVDTLIVWIESFAQFSKNWGASLDTEALCESPAWTELTQWCMTQPSTCRLG